jgi:hypothetical protein
MAVALINKYFNDVVVNNITLSIEMYDEMEGMSADVLASLNDQTRLRRNWLLKTRNDVSRTDVLNLKLREFSTCVNGRMFVRSNHWTVDITCFDDFKHRCHSEYMSLADYVARDLTFSYCRGFFRALELLTMVNEPTAAVQYCIKVRLDKRTVGMYWHLPREFHWMHRHECARQDCACCTGYIDWSPVFAHTCDAWRSNPGTTAESFYTDLIRTHGVMTCDYGTHTFPREPVNPAPGKREREDDESGGARKVRMDEDGVVDMSSDSSDKEEDD